MHSKSRQEVATLCARGFRNALLDAPGHIFRVPSAYYHGNPLQPNLREYSGRLNLVARNDEELEELKRTKDLPRDATYQPRGDLIFFFGDRATAVDFVVTMPVKAAAIAHACKTRGAAAKRAEDKKDAHYKPYFKNLKDYPKALVPLAMEVFGTLGQRYHDLIIDTANAAFPEVVLNNADTDGLRSRFVERMRQHASITLVRAQSAALAAWRTFSCWPGQ